MRLALGGAAGRMGFSLLAASSARQNVAIVGAAERPGSSAIGKDLGELAGLAPNGIIVSGDPAEAAADAEVWVDFSTPDATRAAVEMLRERPTRAAIIGTTGLDAATEKLIGLAAERIAIVRSGNFSRGVTLLAALVEQAAAKLAEDWDIEIIETHHRRKIDAPSGTALLLGEAAARGRGRTLQELRLEPRQGIVGSRPEGGIGFSSVRGGGVVGDHEVLLASEGEMIRLTHHAQDRRLFAEGALDAAAWALAKPPGLYSMRDVLAL